jgi:hypothetical protein
MDRFGETTLLRSLKDGKGEAVVDADEGLAALWSRSVRILRSICALFTGLRLLFMVLGVIR